jgi:hypothetical protein
MKKAGVSGGFGPVYVWGRERKLQAIFAGGRWNLINRSIGMGAVYQIPLSY